MNLKNVEDAANLARKLDMIARMRRDFHSRCRAGLRVFDPCGDRYPTGGMGLEVEREDMEGFLTTLELKYRAALRQLGVDA